MRPRRFGSLRRLGGVGHTSSLALRCPWGGGGGGADLQHRNTAALWNEWLEICLAYLEGTCISGDGQDEKRDEGGAGCELQLLELLQSRVVERR